MNVHYAAVLHYNLLCYREWFWFDFYIA